MLTDIDTGGGDALAQLSTDLVALDVELAQLAELGAAAGANVTPIAEAIRARQARREALLARQAALRKRVRPAVASGGLRADLARRLADWRSLLRQNVAAARPVIELLLAGRVVVTPRRRLPVVLRGGEDLAAFDVRIPLTTREIFEEICGPNGVASPTGFEPVF